MTRNCSTITGKSLRYKTTQTSFFSSLRYYLCLFFIASGTILLVNGLFTGNGETAVYAAGNNASAGHVDLLDLHAEISANLATYVERGMTTAQNDGATAVILEIDTPGGSSDAMRQIISAMINSPVPTVAYVGPQGARAASAGVYICYGANLVAMAHYTNIGSAHPVFIDNNGNEIQVSDDERTKATNDAVAYIRTLASNHNRNVDWAELAVTQSKNIGENEAVQLNVANFIATDRTDLLAKLDGRVVTTTRGVVTLQTQGATIVEIKPGIAQGFLGILSNTTLAYLLLSFGGIGIVAELYNPGSVLPGVVGVIFLLLAFLALGTLSFSYAGLGLIAFAFLLFIADAFAPTHGILTGGGIISFGLGSVLLFDVDGTAGPPWYIIVTVVGTVAIAFIILLRAAILAGRRPLASGVQTMIGAPARAIEPLNPEGYVRINGELWSAHTDGPDVPEGAMVRVVSIEGLKLYVHAEDATGKVGENKE